VTGFVFDHRAADAESVLSRRIVSLLEDESSLASVGAAARRKATEYRLANIADRFLWDFESLRESVPPTAFDGATVGEPNPLPYVR
jgi:hypothetical protein